MPATCHYCGERQSRRRLRPIELSSAGSVQVCRDADACRTRARVGLLVPARAHEVDRRPQHVRGRSSRRWALTLAVLVVGVFVLPHVAIHGRHYHVWLIP